MFPSLPQVSGLSSILTIVFGSLACGVLLGFWLARRERPLSSQSDDESAARFASEDGPAGSSLIAGLSHEIRTPLNGIAGMTNFLVHSDLDEGQHECVQTIQSCVDALLALVNDILDYSKLESGRLQLENIEFDLRSTLEDTLEVFAVQAQSRGIALLLDLPEGECLRFRGDPHRVRQVILNFISNAIKFSRSGGQVTLSLHLVDSGDGTARVKLAVADTGIGISDAKIGRLFQAFQQADASTTREYGGTGLGLAISRGIAERLGGEVGAESVEGEGATFWFEFELERQADESTEDSVDFEGARVLIADPNQSARALLSRQLEAWNIEVTSASTVAEAAAQFEASTPRLALVDECLLGDELSKLVERLGSQVAEAPAICLLGDKRISHETCDGISRTLYKPLKQAKILKVLRSELEGNGADGDDQYSPEGALPSSSESESTNSLEGTHFRRLVRILVVDDNPLNRKVAEKMLQRLGYQAQMAADGREAIEAVSRSPFDLILMDRQMPVMDGLEATLVIREREEGGRRTPIVALTADALDSARKECLEAGMDDFLVKPATGDQLAVIVTRWVNCAQV